MNAMVGMSLLVPIILGATRAAWQQLIEQRVMTASLVVAAMLFTIAAAQLGALNRGPWLGPPAVLLVVISAVRLNIAFTAVLAAWLTASLGFAFPTDAGDTASMMGPVRVWAFGTVLSALALTLQAVLTQQREAERQLHATQLAHQRELLQVASVEQHRLARDMHDALGQELTALSLLTRSLHSRIAESNPALEPHAAEAAQAANQALQSVRQVARGMTQGFREPTDFAKALQSLAERVTRASGIIVNLDLDPARHPTRQPAESLYRIAQEATSNVLRHAQARRLDIRLRCNDRQCELEMTDDGQGFDMRDDAANQGLGLRTMRYRCEIAGGTLNIDSAPGRGTRVTAQLPVQWSRATGTPAAAESADTRGDDTARWLAARA
jgi:signal transduction histidine kinase